MIEKIKKGVLVAYENYNFVLRNAFVSNTKDVKKAVKICKENEGNFQCKIIKTIVVKDVELHDSEKLFFKENNNLKSIYVSQVFYDGISHF